MYDHDAEEPKPHDSQLEAYVLGALDPADRISIEQQLASSPEDREELRQLREVVAMLPYAAPAATPPNHVRERLLARVAASQAATMPATPRPATQAGTRRAWLVPAAMVLFAVLLLGLGTLTLTLRNSVAGLNQTNRELVATLTQIEKSLAQTQSRQAELAAQLATSQQQIATSQQQIATSQEQLAAGQEQIAQLNVKLAQEQYVVAFVSAPGVATRVLNAAQANVAARGEMYMYPGEPNAVVVFSGLPTLQAGNVYQFWLADANAQVAGGTFMVDDTGIATLVVEAPREVNAFQQVMLTIEPAGGSAQPSQQVVLEGSL